ncbi:pollen-specific leucine-rich repeat extensin-like protein 2 [Carya illinoinensis]|uniref:pollen-specific leucine-rich repeat extensin-like protein 2 n=1 Tax=Carya illinoinensis TaxID=32201 RepID=UPI001C723D0D|nr:pollen-specific leucine-rich repeat extensin-like protein 2 [Carya illinoinensis]
MDTEEDKNKARPSTPIPPIQGYYGPRNAYCPPFMMHPNSQPMPPFPTTFIYPPSSNAEESAPPMPHFSTVFIYPSSTNAKESGSLQAPPPMLPFPTTFIYPPSTNAEESGRLQQAIQPPSTSCPPSSTGEELRSTGKDSSNAETASNVGDTSLDVETEAEEINEENSDKDRVEEEPKPSMEFAIDNELMAYYKRYAK